jgi:hypothetical protein
MIGLKKKSRPAPADAEMTKAVDAPADSRPVDAKSSALDSRALTSDVVLRAGTNVTRNMLQTMVLAPIVGSAAKNMVKNRSFVGTLIGAALSRVAMRSVPGALTVGGFLLAKTVYDNKKAKKAQSEGDVAVGTPPASE